MGRRRGSSHGIKQFKYSLTGQAMCLGVYKRNIEERSRNRCCQGKAVSVAHSECVSAALVTQHAKRMRRIILSSVACLAVPYFPTLSHNRVGFSEKVIEHKMYISFSLQSLCEIFSYSKKNSARYYHECTLSLHVEYSLFLLDFNENEIFLSDFRKIFKYKSS
jgi:hypothetical protein